MCTFGDFTVYCLRVDRGSQLSRMEMMLFVSFHPSNVYKSFCRYARLGYKNKSNVTPRKNVHYESQLSDVLEYNPIGLFVKVFSRFIMFVSTRLNRRVPLCQQALNIR